MPKAKQRPARYRVTLPPSYDGEPDEYRLTDESEGQDYAVGDVIPASAFTAAQWAVLLELGTIEEVGK